jgi:hypothetical protein
MSDSELNDIETTGHDAPPPWRYSIGALVVEARRLRAEVRELREKVAGLEAYAQHLEKTADPG